MWIIACLFSEEEFDPNDADHCATVRRVYKPVTALGRQPQSDVYIIGPNLHFHSDGTPIPSERQEYIWLPHILQKLKVPFTPLAALPVVDNRNALQYLLTSMGQILGSNHFSGLFMLSKLWFICTSCGGAQWWETDSYLHLTFSFPTTTPTLIHIHIHIHQPPT